MIEDSNAPTLLLCWWLYVWLRPVVLLVEILMLVFLEEGRHRGAVGYQRLSNLVRKIRKMDVADQEFLITLLTVGGGGQTPPGSVIGQFSHIPRPGDPGFYQTPHTSYDHDSAWLGFIQPPLDFFLTQTRAKSHYSPDTPAQSPIPTHVES